MTGEESIAEAVIRILKNIYLAAPGLSRDKWDPVSRPGMKPRLSASGVGRLSHWTTREVPVIGI